MDTTNTERDIRNFLVNTFLFGRTEELNEDESLLGNVIDSTGTVELVMFLQEHFGITVEDEDVIPENLGSFKTVVAYVDRKLARRSAPAHPLSQ
jgi:acyl carrier protein